MPIRRRFFDWKSPALPAAADFLVDRYCEGDVVDASGAVVALPGGRAGRRLLEILVDLCDERRLTLIPPEITTIGQLPEQLYETKQPFADALTQQLAWMEAVRRTPRETVAHVIPHPPEADDLFAWLSLGEMLSALHRELAADGLDCRRVLQHADELPTFDEADRWQALSELETCYLHEVLDPRDLWDRQTARLFAIEHNLCRTDKDVVLVGAVDMNRAQRQMLDHEQVAGRVTALVFAPDEFADRFDEYGCLIPDTWVDEPANIPADRIEVVDAPGDQADAVVRALAAFEGSRTADEITIGVPDERLVPYIEQRLEECGLPFRYGVGRSAASTGPAMLLAAAADYLETHRFHAFGKLLRHPAIEHRLRVRGVKGDWITELDKYHGNHLPSILPSAWLEPASLKRGNPYKVIEKVRREIDSALSDFTGDPRPPGDWGEAVTAFLLWVYGRETLDEENPRDREVVAFCDRLVRGVCDLRAVHADLAPAVTGAEALRLTLRRLAGDTIPPPMDEASIELLGWLELPLDDAPALIVTGMNEGIVPSSQNHDLFLPNELRRRLSLEDNDRRYARDAYSTAVLLASRPDVKFIAGRRSADNDPLIPSRLLLSTDDEALAARTLALMKPPEPPRLLIPGGLRAGLHRAAFEPRKPEKLEHPVSSMRVTEFRNYIRCPYRYYLRHQLKLDRLDDAAEELNPSDFGTLLHDVLKEFGDSDVVDSTDELMIRECLNAALDRLAGERFGEHRLPAVNVQIELSRMRLEYFAKWQADWAGRGWRIVGNERSIPEESASLDLGGDVVYLRGRIDRIDYNDRTGDWIVFDYKTGDSAKRPKDTHLKKKEWIDLQLPLYWHAAEALEIDRPPAVGYIRVPKKLDETGASLADWDEAMLASGVQRALEIARCVRDEVFWPPADPPPAFSEDYAAICGDGRITADAPADVEAESA